MFKPTATNGDVLDEKSKVPIVQPKGRSATNGDDFDDESKVPIVQQKGRSVTNGDDLDEKSKVPIVQQKGRSATNGDDLDDKSKLPIVQQKGRSVTNGDDLDDKSKVPIVQQKGRSSTNGDDLDDKSKVPIVQQKGRFKVTSESIDFDKTSSVGLPKSHSMQVISQLQPQSGSPTADSTQSYGNLLFQQLHSIMQANIVQRDHIIGMMKQISTCDPSANRSVDGPSITSPTAAASEKTLLETANEKEKELIQEVIELQWRLACLQDEIQRLKAKNAQV